MKKFFAVLLSLSMLAALLGGCMCEVADTDLNADGGGSAEAKFGFSEELVDALDMREKITENGFTYFRYNNRGYYGDQASEHFSNPDEFNAIFAEVVSEITEVSAAAAPGTVTLALASDGGLTLTVENKQSDRRSAIKKELAKQLPDYSDAQLDKLLEGMVMTYHFTFPAALIQYSQGAGITVEGTVVTIDFLALSAGTYRFSTSQADMS